MEATARRWRERSSVLNSPNMLIFFIVICFAPPAADALRPGFAFLRARGRCTPQFWSSRREAWPRMVPQTSTISKVFGSLIYERFGSDLTLLESTARNDEESNAFGGLLKQASAALLNSYAREGYPYSSWQVKRLFIEALVSEKSALTQAKHFSTANQACN
ncbi:hypothetical protein K2173_013684 [Erythroxylum novogranatense]|uniref:Uncharacterized protein n=1 Tax=Erythroxylum novogranatense TaxID=1862640 RepID=A0AAV8SA37_9ROSI|nr:hypothetical protein K2173_013684 [Erythroxylum novogranatense]